MNEARKDQIFEMSKGNPGCISVLVKTYNLVGDSRFVPIMDTLQANGITGSLVWVEYKDKHGENIEAFVGAVEANLVEPMTDRRGLVADMKAR